MKLSENLELAEVIRSSTAKRLGIKNEPTAIHLNNLKILAEKIFQPIRNHFGRPIFISSGYRSAALNKATPGASTTSQHSRGEAIDIDMDGTEITNAQIFEFIKENLEFDQLIAEFPTKGNPSWVHVSYESKGSQRNQILVAKKINGKTSYIPYKNNSDLN
jgi:zinc D-Ala-D-Ala carboxypeptidase